MGKKAGCWKKISRRKKIQCKDPGKGMYKGINLKQICVKSLRQTPVENLGQTCAKDLGQICRDSGTGMCMALGQASAKALGRAPDKCVLKDKARARGEGVKGATTEQVLDDRGLQMLEKSCLPPKKMRTTEYMQQGDHSTTEKFSVCL